MNNTFDQFIKIRIKHFEKKLKDGLITGGRTFEFVSRETKTKEYTVLLKRLLKQWKKENE